MNDVPLETFQKAILATHGGAATLVARHRVADTFDGQTVWNGEVLEFMIPRGTVWAWEVGGRVTAVLKEGPVDSPLAAVRAGFHIGCKLVWAALASA